MSNHDHAYWHPDTPTVEIHVSGVTGAGSNSRKINSRHMKRTDDYKLYVPREGDHDGLACDNYGNVVSRLDLRRGNKDGGSRRHDVADDDTTSSQTDLHIQRAVGRSCMDRLGREEAAAAVSTRRGQRFMGTAEAAGYTPRDPRRVVRVSPRAKKTYNTWAKFEKMYADDRENNVNPCFMSSMGEYDDPWSRECKQRKKARDGYVGDKEWIVTPHRAAVAKRARQQAQTSVTARGPYLEPHEVHERFYFDRRKWIHGPWHIPAPQGSFTMRGEAFAAASAVTKGAHVKGNSALQAANGIQEVTRRGGGGALLTLGEDGKWIPRGSSSQRRRRWGSKGSSRSPRDGGIRR